MLDLQSILACRKHNDIQSTGVVQDAVCGQGARFIESDRCRADHLAWRSPASALPLSLVPERVPDSVQLGQSSADPFARLICDTLRPPLCFEQCISRVVNRRRPYFCTVGRLCNRHGQNIATSRLLRSFFSPLVVDCRVVHLISFGAPWLACPQPTIKSLVGLSASIR